MAFLAVQKAMASGVSGRGGLLMSPTAMGRISSLANVASLANDTAALELAATQVLGAHMWVWSEALWGLGDCILCMMHSPVL